ncbi:MAG TPA: hypothetical protein VJ803_09925 [Gemmatimonadaceae bacterium]|nr:hypothetical protein [Gemmatimonadaceae bacterium]
MIPDRGGRWAAVALAAAGFAACTEITADPTVPFAIEVDPPASPSVVIGDSLRDTLGNSVPLTVRVLNSKHEVIPDAAVTFISFDTANVLTLDPQTGAIVGLSTGEAGIVASADGLQSERVAVRVTPMPDVLTGVDAAVDTIEFVLGTETLLPLRVRLEADTNAALTTDPLAPVPSYLVRYGIVSPPELANTDVTTLHLVDDSRRPSTVDTTNTLGDAGRQLMFPALISPPIPDSVVVHVTARRPDLSPVPGSPVVYVVKLRPAGTP